MNSCVVRVFGPAVAKVMVARRLCCCTGTCRCRQVFREGTRPATATPGAHVSIRPIKRIIQSRPTIEGAGVRLRRAFGFDDTEEYDPFLLLDDFRNERPEDYRAGFPWHPHRGIETITYVLAGAVEPGDSLGNRGMMGAGDVQWIH